LGGKHLPECEAPGRVFLEDTQQDLTGFAKDDTG